MEKGEDAPNKHLFFSHYVFLPLHRQISSSKPGPICKGLKKDKVKILNKVLTLSQTVNFRPFQIKRACR